MIACCILAVGLHLGSVHIDPSAELLRQNPSDSNHGVYVEFAGNVIVGTYRNTLRKQSNYAGYVYHFNPVTVAGVKATPSIVFGAVTGYPLAPVAPLILPSVSFAVADKLSLRLSYLPKMRITGAHVLHASAEYRF